MEEAAIQYGPARRRFAGGCMVGVVLARIEIFRYASLCARCREVLHVKLYFGSEESSLAQPLRLLDEHVAIDRNSVGSFSWHNKARTD